MNHLKLLLLIFYFFSSCSNLPHNSPKINGVSFVASRDKAVQQHIDPVLSMHANHAAVMPFGFIKSLDHPEIMYNTNRQWFGETNDGARQYIKKLHENTIEVMLKPQIWIWQGEYTGKLKMKSEEDWKILEDSYRVFILDFAKIAQETNTAMLCIGTELEEFVNHRPTYWDALIKEIKDIYDGKLTYAANWDEYKRVPFWKELDFIGVDAYFPISESKTPTIEEAKMGWQTWKLELKELSQRHKKQIVFTEFGYRSVDFAGREPWDSNHEWKGVNLDAQTILTKALFEEHWNEEWFAGGFVWKWFIDHSKVGGTEDNQFTPQNKPVEAVIKDVFSLKK
ncbi:glycoside hydrolase [Ulvibacter sp.]|nr:glycoside hydrolase [Ulvibacter sp.]